MTIGLVRDVRGTRLLINFEEKINQYFGGDFVKSLKLAITPSVFVIQTYILTI